MPRFRRWLRWLLALFVALALAGAIAAGALYYIVSSKLPDVQSLREVELQEPMYVYASDGKLMAVFGETRRYPIEMKDVPERLKQAFLATEDARFYEHGGVDYKGIARAVWLLATTSDKRVPGGSTITQQVARQFFLSSEYSYTRKLAEILLARKIESELSKDEIFELYLNKSFFGNRAYGIGAAAEYYYGKKLADLDLDEMASLAGIPKFPSSGNPISNPERARQRRERRCHRPGQHRRVDVRPQDEGLAPVRHRQRRVFPLRGLERALRLGVVERERPAQALVEVRLRPRVARADLQAQRAEVVVQRHRAVGGFHGQHRERPGFGGLRQHQRVEQRRTAGDGRGAQCAAQVEHGVVGQRRLLRPAQQAGRAAGAGQPDGQQDEAERRRVHGGSPIGVSRPERRARNGRRACRQPAPPAPTDL